MKLKILNISNNALPEYKTEGAAGMDLSAWLPDGPIIVKPFERLLISTGLIMEIEPGHEGQVRPRSGLSIKHGITLVATGTIDSDYRGEVKIPIINLSNESFVIENGDRIAQIIFAECKRAVVTEVDSKNHLSSTRRDDDGFGSTGITCA